MKIRKTVFSFFVLAFLISCSDENTPNDAPLGFSEEVSAVGGIETLLTEEETKVLLRMRSPDNHVGIEEAMKLTYEFVNSFYDEKALKSSVSRKISSVSALVSGRKPALKSGEETGKRFIDGFNG